MRHGTAYTGAGHCLLYSRWDFLGIIHPTFPPACSPGCKSSRMFGGWRYRGTLRLSPEIVYLTSVKIDFPKGPSIHLEATHPRIFYLVGFLLTSVSKRDAMGRKPRRKIFATEGLKAWEREIIKPFDCTSFTSSAALSFSTICRSFVEEYF